MSRELRIHHVGIAVPDLDAAIEWYGRVLGFANPERHEADPLAPGLPPPFAMFIRDPGGTLIELLDGAPVAAEPGPDP